MANIVYAVTKDDTILTLDASVGVAYDEVPETGFRIICGTEAMWAYQSSADGKQVRVRRGIDGTTKAVHAALATVTYASGDRGGLFVKAGVVSDADFPNDLPPVGFVAWDNTNFKFSVRTAAGVWKQSAALA